MKNPQTPKLSNELAKRIKIVRRDMSGLLFHFTRTNGKNSASDILKKILNSKTLLGTGTWTEGINCVCFTEAPIQEFASIFSLVEIAASIDQRPRYEPYGIAVSKEWFFEQGGRPVIYDSKSNFGQFSNDQSYRLVPYEPENNIDFTWEREWRIKKDELKINPKKTLVVVPTSDEAFDFMDSYLREPTGEGSTASYDVQASFRMPTWMAVSLDLFGLEFSSQ